MLRLAKHPMTSVEITDKLMAMKGIDASDAKARTGLRRTVLNLLKAGGTKSYIERIEGRFGEASNWRIAP